MPFSRVSGAPTRRDVQQLITSTSGRMRGTKRTHQPVRRRSYDVGDKRADVARPFGGTKREQLDFRDSLFRTAQELQATDRQHGTRGPLSTFGLHVLHVLLYRFADLRTGRCDPALDTIAKVAGVSRRAVVTAIARLKAHGFLSWVRRTEATGAAPGEGPQVRQVSNAYFFDLAGMKKRVRQRLQDLMRGRVRRRENAAPATPAAAPPEPAAPPAPADHGLAAALARLDARLGE